MIDYGRFHSASKGKPDRALAQVWALYPHATAILIRYGYNGWWRYTVWIEVLEVSEESET
jgi:hypothetical protein